MIKAKHTLGIVNLELVPALLAIQNSVKILDDFSCIHLQVPLFLYSPHPSKPADQLAVVSGVSGLVDFVWEHNVDLGSWRYFLSKLESDLS